MKSAAYMNMGLFPARTGTMTLIFNCSVGSDIRVNKVTLSVPRAIEKYFGKVADIHGALEFGKQSTWVGTLCAHHRNNCNGQN
jgi:hypothetical protein